ncbi:MAG: hypothetical protein M3O98_08420 [Actinomycetota bacterium]|nr:hypothetical protein [Actinomycetota bacterium]
MTRQTALLLALGMLVAAALSVGVTGWILLVRDRRSAKPSQETGHGPHPERSEGP